MVLFCHVISQDHAVKWLCCDLMSRSPPEQITTLQSLVALATLARTGAQRPCDFMDRSCSDFMV